MVSAAKFSTFAHCLSALLTISGAVKSRLEASVRRLAASGVRRFATLTFSASALVPDLVSLYGSAHHNPIRHVCLFARVFAVRFPLASSRAYRFD